MRTNGQDTSHRCRHVTERYHRPKTDGLGAVNSSCGQQAEKDRNHGSKKRCFKGDRNQTLRYDEILLCLVAELVSRQLVDGSDNLQLGGLRKVGTCSSLRVRPYLDVSLCSYHVP